MKETRLDLARFNPRLALIGFPGTGAWLWLQARKNIARRTSIYGRSSCNGLRVRIQIRFCRGDWKELFALTSNKGDFCLIG